MHIVYYHPERPALSQEETNVLDRAAHKQHMRKKTLLWDIAALLLTSIAGPLLHTSILAHIPALMWLVPVNESVWEHGKLLFYPLLLTGMVRRLFTGKLQHGILTTFAGGILLGLFVMTGGYYLYSGILGWHFLTADIALFYIALLVSLLFIRKTADRQKKNSLPGMLILLLLAGCFVYFTYYPPEIGLFLDFSQAPQ